MLDTTKIIFVISTLPEDIYVDVKRVSFQLRLYA